MEFDLTITMSVIIGLVATLPQIVVAIINNIYQAKIKNLEIYELQKRESLQNFINASIECFKNDNDWAYNKEFVKSLYSLQLYFKCANTEMIEDLNKLMNNSNDRNKFKVSFALVITRLSKEIKKK